MTTQQAACGEAVREGFPRRHELKTWPEPFAAIVRREKTFEFRKDDRGFRVGDHLLLREWYAPMGGYTKAEWEATVTYIARGPDWGIPEGYVIMSLAYGWLRHDRPAALREAQR